MKKRILAGLLSLSLLFTSTACGKKNGDGNTGSGASITEDVKDTIFAQTDEKFDGIEGSVNSIAVVGDNIVIGSIEYLDVEIEDDSMMDDFVPLSSFKLYTIPTTGGTAKLIREDTHNTADINSIFSADGNIGIWLSEYDENNMESGRIIVLDSSGKELKNIDLGFAYNEGSYLSKVMYLAADDTVICCYDDLVKATDSAGKKKFTLPINGYLMDSGITKDDIPVLDVYGEEEELMAIDVSAGAFKGASKKASSNIGGELIRGVGSYDFTYMTKSAVYGYILDENREVKICDFTASDIDVANLENCIVLDNDKILIYSYNSEADKSCLNSYKRIDPADYAEKKELSIMCLYAPDSLRKLVLDFNRSSSEYRVNIIDYSETDNPYEKMSADITAGKLPDIYYLDNGIATMSTEQCAAKGLLEDLTPYLENDADVSSSDLISSVFEATKIDGKVYYLSGYFSLKTLIGRQKDLGDKSGWTFEELSKYIESKPDSVRLLESDNKGDMLMTLLSASMSDFVDWEKGECYFDSEEFKNLLEMCNRGSDEEKDWEDSDFVQDILSGKQLLVDGDITPDEVALYEGLFGGDLTYIGYPNKNRDGVYAFMGDSFAISSLSENKDAAWEFIKQIITRDYQGENYYDNMEGCPTRKDIYEMYLKTYITDEVYTDEFGNEVLPREGSMGMNQLVVDIKPLSQQEIDRFNSQIDSISRTWSVDTSLYEIISEEAAAYFAGDKSVDETASLIQDRAQTYIKESK